MTDVIFYGRVIYSIFTTYNTTSEIVFSCLGNLLAGISTISVTLVLQNISEELKLGSDTSPRRISLRSNIWQASTRSQLKC